MVSPLWMAGVGEDGGERTGARMVGAAVEAILAPFHRWRAGRGRGWRGGRGGILGISSFHPWRAGRQGRESQGQGHDT
jgi:hypothetical protein